MKSVKETQTVKVKTSCGTLYITHGDGLLFLNMGKCGTCARAMTEALGRVIAIALRYKTSKDELIKSLKGIQCMQSQDKSCITLIAETLEAQNVKTE